jgi:hypothetical protein
MRRSRDGDTAATGGGVFSVAWWKSAIGSASYSRSIHRTSSMNVNVPAVDGVI